MAPPPPPPEPLLRFDQIRQLDTSGPNEDEEQFARGRYWLADCPAPIIVGDFVRIAGAAIGGVRQVDKVDVTDRSKMPAIGIVISKATSTRCLVQTFGEIPASGLVPGARYFVGSGGTISPADAPPAPAGSGSFAVVQVVGQAMESTTLLLNVTAFAIVRRGV